MPVLARLDNSIVADENYYIRNNHKAPSTYTHGHAVHGEVFRWQGKGDPAGQDVLSVPGYVIKSYAFRQAMNRGIFSFVEEGDLTVEAGAEEWAFSQGEHESSILANLDRESERDLYEAHCKGPGATRGQECGEALWIRHADLDKKPPLCARHEKYENYFAFDGTEWNRISPNKGA